MMTRGRNLDANNTRMTAAPAANGSAFRHSLHQQATTSASASVTATATATASMGSPTPQVRRRRHSLASTEGVPAAAPRSLPSALNTRASIASDVPMARPRTESWQRNALLAASSAAVQFLTRSHRRHHGPSVPRDRLAKQSASPRSGTSTTYLQTTSPRELAVLRYQYVAHNVHVLDGARWKLRSYALRSVRLETGATPQLTIFLDALTTRVVALPVDTDCQRHGALGVKLTSRQQRGFCIRIRFATRADAAIWSRLVREAVAHAQWCRDLRHVGCLSDGCHAQVNAFQSSVTQEEWVLKVLPRRRVDGGADGDGDGGDELGILQRLTSAVPRLSASWKFLSEYRVVETETDVQIVMPRFVGQTLLEFLSSRPAPHHVLSELEARTVTRALCLALQELHSHGVVHCDIKLENILLNGVSDVRLIDLGAAYDCAGANRPLTSTGPRPRERMMGTPGYIAPERVLQVDEPPTSASDVFSLGIVVYQILVGQHPFTRARAGGRRRLTLDDSLSLEWRHMEAQLQRRGVSRSAQQLVEKLVDRDPKQRIPVDQILKHAWFRQV